ncbi:MAG TPA: folylpolyglutamate synthase/dihydrofolate synthase family protein [Gemmatimonadaceae bacterium]|nr:folylpolyglutamate synthase/dihydrofolate synthase family protein [Gemmatimonadaceae bacterium]
MDSGLTVYQSALDKLFARTGSTAKFGLDRTRALLARLGNPHEQFKSFHVAGTNGKGSVVTTLDTLLRAKGLRVGRYTSPHLIDFRERIVVDDVPINEEEVNDFLSRWESPSEELGATFFEITSALAFHHFAERNVDVAVIETGLGGRLDSTNVITPLVAGVTSIAMDHTEYLGDTLTAIASEKAGIYKEGVPAVYGPVSEEIREALRATASKRNACPIVAANEVYRVSDVRVSIDGTTFSTEHDTKKRTLHTGLVGFPQAMNASVALTMLECAGEPYRTTLDEADKVLPTVKLPGRFDRRGKFIFDVAHNPDGIAALVDTLDLVDVPQPLVAVLGVLRDKDWRGMMAHLCPRMDHTFLTAPSSAPANRAWNPAEAAAFADDNGWRVDTILNLDLALEAATKEAGTVLVTGSFHTVGDALQLVDAA